MADPLEQNLIRIWNQLITERRLKLRSSLSEYAALTSGVLTYGSLLSGTLIEGIALPAILQMVQKKTAVHLEPRLAFACENVAWKRALLQDDERGIKVPVFTCVHEMARSPECATDCDGKTWNIPRVGLLVFAIECDSISGLASGWSLRLRCVDDAARSGTDSRTGSTAVSCMQIVEFLRPPFFIAECVKNLTAKDQSTGKSAFQAIIEMAVDAGYTCESYQLDAKEYGVPQSRTRSFLFGAWVGKNKALAIFEASKTAAGQHQQAFEAMLEELKISPLSLHEYLDHSVRPREEATVQSSTAAPTQAAKRRKQAHVEKPVKQSVFAYEEKHLEVYTQMQLQWPPHFTEEFEVKTVSIAGSRRMQEVLYLEEHRLGPARSMTSYGARDLHMTEEWGVMRHAHLPCIVGSSVIWVRGTLQTGQVIDRRLHGTEALAVQGLGHKSQTAKVKALSYEQTLDLAGNMFVAEVFSVVFLTAFATIDVSNIHRAVQTSRLHVDDASHRSQSQDDGESMESESAESDEEEEPDAKTEIDDLDIDDLNFDN